jgi:hypothetical protein
MMVFPSFLSFLSCFTSGISKSLCYFCTNFIFWDSQVIKLNCLFFNFEFLSFFEQVNPSIRSWKLLSCKR